MSDKSLIVCVDDDPTLLSTVARSLRSPAFEVRATLSAEQALGWISDEDVAVLVSDYEMPEMSGAELAAAALRVRPETVRILLTGQTSLSTAIDGFHRGEIFRFLTKPFDVQVLRDAVQAGVERHLELLSLSSDRKRRERRELLRRALEAEYPGISHVVRGELHHEVTNQPWATAAELGLIGLTVALEES